MNIINIQIIIGVVAININIKSHIFLSDNSISMVELAVDLIK